MSFACRRLSLVSAGLLLTALGCATILRFPDPSETVRYVPHNPRNDLKFDHEIHDGLDCVSCHSGLGEDVEAVEDVTDKTGLMSPAKQKCFECHSRGLECAFCHQDRRADVKPPTHTAGFVRDHGRAAEDPSARCDWCHGRGVESCQDCHLRMTPVNHGPRWANSQHGRHAVHDRKQCFVCHQSVSCARCHSQPPEYHTAAFVAGGHRTLAQRNRRACIVCHDFQRTCAKCHN